MIQLISFEWNLISYAYLKAMDNYFEVDEAISFAGKAKTKNPGSYTINMIVALLKAQKALNYLDQWCKVYNLTKSVREEKY